MNMRTEHDTMGEIAVPAERHWGAQTQRSLENFRIGGEKQPEEIITAFAYLKEACAQANRQAFRLQSSLSGQRRLPEALPPAMLYGFVSSSNPPSAVIDCALQQKDMRASFA